MGAAFPKACHTAYTMCAKNRPVFFRYDPKQNRWIIHPLQVPFQNNVFVGNNLSLDTWYKSRDHLIVSIQTSKCFELHICIVACAQNKVRELIGGFHWWQAFWIVFSFWNQQRVNTNYCYFLHIPLFNMWIQSFCIIG